MSALRAFDTLIDVVLAIDAAGAVRYGNGPASELLEASVKRLASGKPLAQWVELSGDDFSVESLTAATEPTPYREVRFATASGREGWMQVSAQPAPRELVPDGWPPLWILFARDVSLEKTLHEKYRAELDKKEAVITDLKSAREQLEDYSRNLEKMVAERTRELSDANALLRAVLDSLGQGIVVFDSVGRLLPMRSKVTATLFEKDPAGLTAADLLGLRGAARDSFARWLEATFADLLAFEDMAPLGPSTYAHGGARSIALDYNEMRSAAGTLEGIVMVATDRTSEVRALAEAERERRFARMVALVAGHRPQFRAFAGEARQLAAQLEAACASSASFPWDDASRWLHTLKGGASSFALDDLAAAAHEAESEMIGARENRAPEESLKASLGARARALSAALEAFLVERAELFGGMPSGSGRAVEVPVARLLAWAAALDLAPEGRAQADEIRREWTFEPLQNLFKHLADSASELASSLGKDIEPIEFAEGGDLLVAPEDWAALIASFVHAFRNAVDHGLEAPADRVVAGKAEKGAIRLRARRRERDGRSWLTIEVEDDGRGVDPAKLRAKLAEKGDAGAALARGDDHDVIQAVFLDDVSTAQTATALSGRGVGLSALRAEARAMGGDARMESEPGRGARLIVEVPEPELGNAKRFSSPAIRRTG